MIRSLIEPIYESHITRQCKFIPQHVALILDGNRRYARKKGLTTTYGHRAGADRVQAVLQWAQELGIQYITLYLFSTENFNRTDTEVHDLFSLFSEYLNKIVDDERVHKNRIRIQMIGDRDLLPDDIRRSVEKAEAATAHYDRYFLNMALAYGGRNEIVQVTKEIIGDIRMKKIDPREISPALLEEYLYGKNISIPPVDLIIRTANECRTSNFLPWLANGHESAVYFCAPFWPMFRKIDMLRAIRVYSQRKQMLERSKNRAVKPE